jgi:hypothetical protein
MEFRSLDCNFDAEHWKFELRSRVETNELAGSFILSSFPAAKAGTVVAYLEICRPIFIRKDS